MLRGMGTTYSFVPRRSGMGDDLTPPDILGTGPGGPPPIDWGPGPEPPPLPPGWFTNPKPILPKPKILPVTPPDIGPGPRPQIVFPSSSSVPPPPKFAAAPAPTAGWLDQQMIAGIPNSYLAIATAGLVLFVSMSGAKRRR